MPTPAERQALLFLAAVTVLGTGVRVARAVGEREAVPPVAERALAAQIAEVEEKQLAKERAQEEREKARQAKGQQAPTRARGARVEPVRYGSVDVQEPPIDVDRASAAELDRLPRIGPTLAARIVANRDSFGAFGSVEELQRVKGIGPALARALGNRVTFSGNPRPTSAGRLPPRRRP